MREKGEKSAWTYIEIAPEIAQKINPGVKTSYRVKGSLDTLEVSGLSLLPMGGGSFILPLNADLRKNLRKTTGELLIVKLTVDASLYMLNAELLEALESESKALIHFNSLSKSHQNYFSKWIESAKTTETRYSRIESCFIAMIKKQSFAEMLRERKKDKDGF
ncbi:MAG: DUF1905 domain-containing protein [Saprospiraceae bacterium]|nr:DUF1905 domain-containing protein [Saprospiraceae bacterium]